MDTDFHFYGTASAAKSAGFSAEQAQLIGNAAEYVDFYNSDFWSYWSIVDQSGNNLLSIDVPQLSCQTIGAKMAIDYQDDLWNAFHFPPGNLQYSAKGRDVYAWQADFRQRFKARETRSGIKGTLLCRPYSKFAHDMILDTIERFKSLMALSKITNGQEAQQGLQKALNAEFGVDKNGNPRRLTTANIERLAHIFLGIRMHVLADTWAHQDFSGIASKDLNGAGTLNNVYYPKNSAPDIWQQSTWTGSLWVFASDTDCAAAPNAPGSQACRGHGQVGHYPDYSWLSFFYPAAWMSSGSFLLRSNPEQYNEAWLWLRRVMAEALGKSTTDMNIPTNVQAVIAKPVELNSKKLEAVELKEKQWQQLDLCSGFSLADRWNNKQGVFDKTKRNQLGVVGDLPSTRLGTLKIKQNSDLHLMELASAFHYLWSSNWAKNNKEYGWSPVGLATGYSSTGRYSYD
ncbi:hypothetical protein NI389_18330 (plasmid) [Pseudoalteromonas xiamenensis]|uniref:DUF6765 family protein n=1 Tax=Pseudoalteromonas xiamenensis TaxID=882626 RepID=UPI0027E50FFA|nr:DUF6765 family protein [Pseudoalteromonas xiamenensis]WMN61767.1 hypothetical protein NI389_18330 [Pseudoalteromonas xiamenensis]